jgi:PAS domain S-box-containing protein
LDTQTAAAAPGAVANSGFLRRYGAAGIVLLVGLCAALATFLLLRATDIRNSEVEFAVWTDEHRDLLQKEVDAHLQVLYGVRALFDSSEFVSAQEFNRYTAGFLERYPHMHSLDWLPRVPHVQRTEFEQRASAALGIEYRIRHRAEDGSLHTADERQEYWPIYYTQARDGWTRLGIDAHARSTNAAAMERAAQRNDPSTARLELAAPDEPPVERLLVYLPVYDGDAPEDGSVLGFVRTGLSIDDMMRETLHDAAEKGIALELVDPRDGGIVGAMTPVGGPPLRRLGALNPRQLQSKRDLLVADMTMHLNFASSPGYIGHPRLAPIYGLLAGGIVVTFLGAYAAFQLTRRRLHLQTLTQELMSEVAERRSSERRLLESEARYRVLVENSPDAIILNQGGQIRFADDAAARLLGATSPEQLVGKSVYTIVHPDFHEIVRTRMSSMMETCTALPAAEQRLVRLDGAIIDVDVLAAPFRTATGVVIQVTARDITQRRAAEIERRTLEAALRQSQKLEAVGTLAGGIAHDFNNILSAVIGNTRLVLEDLPETHPAWRSVREIREAAHRARDLVKRLMAFSRQQETQRTAVPVEPLIREVQQLLRATLPAGVELVVRAPPDPPAILADATQIHQVLLNLCTNAWQAMAGDAGCIEITVDTLAPEAARAQSGAALESAARYVRIGVHDNGAGMSPETLEHIFEPFFTTKGPGEGSGLGLAVVHGIVQSHNGAITVSSRPGAGSSFLIYLPASDAPAPQGESAQRVSARGLMQHVLYVDDEEPLVFLVVRTLERAGFRCTGELDAVRALERVRMQPGEFDLVITDLNMPGINGLEVARELLSIRPDLPIVITTGYVRADDVAAARALGVREMILKPDTIEELAAIVHRNLA